LTLTDPAAFSRVYDAHAAGVYAVAHEILRDPGRAQDVAQDVFLRLWRRPDRFDAGRADLGTYLRLLARSRSVDLLRQQQAARRARDRLCVVVARAEGRVDEHPGPAVERSTERRWVREALRTLPHAQREALVLAYWGGLTAEQIARRGEVPLGTAKSRLRLGMAKLRAERAAAVA
jgi:RNA polymerase sigma-70 factor (ECF subfamily)